MGVDVVFWSVVTARFVLPLFIPKYPLPAIIGCLVLDAADQTIFQAFGFNPPFYQSYDKAMDVFYLSVAYTASLRNWTSHPAFRINRFLFFYRQIGVVAFELTGLRWLLLVFPNTFEYFFIAYETVRTRWNPLRWGFKFWVIVAGAIWIFIKLPQEYWIHIAQLDVTDTIRDVPWFGPALLAGILLLIAVLWFVVRPRLPQTDWSLRLAADPLPAGIDEARERAAFQAKHRKVFDEAALEKIFLIGLISVIYGRVLPGVEASSLQIFLAVAFYAIVNAGLGLWAAKRGHSWESAGVSFAVVFATNVVLVAVADLLLTRGDGRLQLTDTLFFVFLFSILTTLYDRYRPIHDYRVEMAKSETTT
ncbi:hypothetical protein ACXC9Q_17885 [Kribbella sp. CWNU-51]